MFVRCLAITTTGVCCFFSNRRIIKNLVLIHNPFLSVSPTIIVNTEECGNWCSTISHKTNRISTKKRYHSWVKNRSFDKNDKKNMYKLTQCANGVCPKPMQEAMYEYKQRCFQYLVDFFLSENCLLNIPYSLFHKLVLESLQFNTCLVVYLQWCCRGFLIYNNTNIDYGYFTGGVIKNKKTAYHKHQIKINGLAIHTPQK